MSSTSSRFSSIWPFVLGICVVLASVGGYLMGRNTTPMAETTPTEVKAEAEPTAEKGVVAFEPETLKLAALKIETVQTMPMAARRVVTGQITPDLSGLVRVTPRVEGRVVQLLANVGDTVRAGQTLAVVESEKLHIAQIEHQLAVKRVALAKRTLEQRRKLAALGEFSRPKVEEARSRIAALEGETRKARSEREAAQSDILEAKSALRTLHAALTQAQTKQEVAQSRLKRAEALYQDELLSRQDLEQAQAERKQAQSDVEAAQAHIAQGEAKIVNTEARLRTTEAALEAAQKQQEVAKQALTRAEAVYKGAYLTSKEVAEAESAYEQAKIEEAGALDDVQLLGGKPGDLHEVPVVAPIGGRITERTVTLGETVVAERPLFTVMNGRTVWAMLDVYPDDVSSLRTRQEVLFTADTLPGKTFRGTISHIGDTADETTRTVKVRCAVRSAGGALKPGVFVEGRILGAAGKSVVVVPNDAVQTVNGETVVYTPTGNEGEFRETPVQVGRKQNSVVEIRAGLKPGDKIVTKNAFLVKSQAMKGELAEEE